MVWVFQNFFHLWITFLSVFLGTAVWITASTENVPLPCMGTAVHSVGDTPEIWIYCDLLRI